MSISLLVRVSWPSRFRIDANKQEQGGKGDGILPGGKGRSTIFVDTSTVSHYTFFSPSSFPVIPSSSDSAQNYELHSQADRESRENPN